MEILHKYFVIEEVYHILDKVEEIPNAICKYLCLYTYLIINF